MKKNEIIATATINPVLEAVRAALEPDNLVGVLIEGTATRVRAVGPLPSLTEDLGWLTRHLAERIANGTLKSGEVVFNRYVAWTNEPETLRSGRDPAKDAYDEAKQASPGQSPVLNWEVRVRTLPSGRVETNVVSVSVAGDPSPDEEIVARCKSAELANAVVECIYDNLPDSDDS